MKRNIKRITLPTRVGSFLISVFGDFDNIVRIKKTARWIVDTNYIVQLGHIGISKLVQYRQVGSVTLQEVAEVVRKHQPTLISKK